MQGYQYLTMSWCFVAITFIFVVMRVYIRVHVRGGITNLKSWHLSEVLIILAWIDYFAMTIIDSWLNDNNWYNTDPELIAEVTSQDYKMFWGLASLYWLGMYWIKASMLAFYFEIILRDVMFKMWCVTIAVCVFTLAGAITTVGLILGGCRPISRIWDVNGNNCDIYDNPVHGTIVCSFAMATDFAVWTVPFCVIPTLGRQHRKSVAFMFALGFLCVACSIMANTILIYALDIGITDTNGYVFSLREFSVLIEQAVGLAVACMPGFKGFLRVGPGLWISNSIKSRSWSVSSSKAKSAVSSDKSSDTAATASVTPGADAIDKALKRLEVQKAVEVSIHQA